MDPRIGSRRPILRVPPGGSRAELLPGPADLINPSAIGIVTHESKAGIRPESNGPIKAARIGQRYPMIQSGITTGAGGFD